LDDQLGHKTFNLKFSGLIVARMCGQHVKACWHFSIADKAGGIQLRTIAVEHEHSHDNFQGLHVHRGARVGFSGGGLKRNLGGAEQYGLWLHYWGDFVVFGSNSDIGLAMAAHCAAFER
jgi:hypothetical protein